MGLFGKTLMTTNSTFNVWLLLWSAGILSTSLGFDGSMMSSLNILPSYTDYFHLDTTTLALQSAASWAGSTVAGIFMGQVADFFGRKNGLLISALLTMIGAIIQACSQNIGMFVAARFIVGIGNGATYACGPTYLVEMFPLQWRGIGLAIFQDFFYIGGLISSGVTYGTAKMNSTWAWRLPSVLQIVFMIMGVIVLPFMPESPRWLLYKDRHEEAIESIAAVQGNGNRDDPIVLLTYQEIVETLKQEAEAHQKTNFQQLVKSKQSMRRLMLVLSVAIISMASGNNIVTFYLGKMLDNAGITNSTTQLEINIILNCWCLVVACCGTLLVDKVGRRPLAIWSSVAMTAFLFIMGGLTKLYGDSTNTSGIYGTVAMMFLFMGAYSFGWTPLSQLYPPEVLNYSVRSVGMGAYTFLANGIGLMVAMAFPYALDAIGWKTYMINGCWDVLQLVFVIIFWVETQGKTLEEIDEIFDERAATAGMVHIQDVIEGRDVDVAIKNAHAVSVSKVDEAGATAA
ncbi:hexose transporter [Grosmannia clavigera kw1407]|uniref:Hexose transporter n=1 Tax=Grosmannia clavigera (strain kw1407 / UAMH 11150) TaxID=655863 RepID=F0XMP2_GROCL|nr:hexose transporter [Grosmannia clavigera kw1407]EFX01519.1 hexose transporter [Grosmannia clavigera kw1407]